MGSGLKMLNNMLINIEKEKYKGGGKSLGKQITVN